MHRSIAAIISILGLVVHVMAKDQSAPLLPQLEKVVDVLKDSYAQGYASEAIVQKIDGAAGNGAYLTVFTIEGFGGGNNASQYMAIFDETDGEDGKKAYPLLDVVKIGGDAWRFAKKKKAQLTVEPKTKDIHIALDALVNTQNDPPNFPSKKGIIGFTLHKGRLTEDRH